MANEDTPDVFSQRIAAERIGSWPLDVFANWMDRAKDVDVSDPSKFDEMHQHFDRAIRCVYEDEVKYEWDGCGNRLRYELDSERPCKRQVVSEEASIPAYAHEFFNGDIDTLQKEIRAAEESEI